MTRFALWIMLAFVGLLPGQASAQAGFGFPPAQGQTGGGGAGTVSIAGSAITGDGSSGDPLTLAATLENLVAAMTVSSGGQISWPTGLGAITHVLGPTDQNLKIQAPASRNLVLGAGGADLLTLTAAGLVSATYFDCGASGIYYMGSASMEAGTGAPEGVLAANQGALYTRTDGGVGSTLYYKTGGGNTSWNAVGDYSAMGDIAQTGSVSLAGAGTTTSQGHLRRVYTYTGGSGAATTLTASQTEATITNEGATTQAYVTLPTAVAGLHFRFVLQDADGIRVTAATGDTIRVLSLTSATAGYAQSTTIGSVLTLEAINATEWVAVSAVGTWSVDS